MKVSRDLVIIATASVLMTVLIGLLIQPVYANFCAANITSDPSGADVYIDGALKGQTPYYYSVGSPFTVNLTVKKAGYETWSQTISAANEVTNVNVVLTAASGPAPIPKGAATVTTTVTSTFTTTSPTTITVTTATTQTLTTTLATTIISSAPAQTVTTTREVTQTTGLPSEVTYAAVGVAVIALIAAAVLATRKK